ncbi:MAG: 50S ribosomal protein L24 [Bdellovibrionaceae bacterium]|nr:50S ribosomal protein L24 [Pseudobdellovibrionaceae bacterium]
MKLKIKKGSTVQVIAGAEKGKKGTVLEIVTSKMGVRVAGIRVQTHFDKKEGLLKKEGLIHYSNLKLVDGPAASSSQAKTKKAKSKSGVAKKAST